jgi:Raf kinase inhibitor-like YbhB/YbcL family protein
MHMRHGFSALAIVAICAASVSAQTPAAITVTSPTLKANEVVPIDHTADGKNVSPALMWSGAPAATKQFALVYDDPDVVFGGQTFVHWVAYKIPGTAKGLPAELPMDAVLTAPADIAGTIQGLSGFKRTGYRGPAPPPGKPHHYTWTV